MTHYTICALAPNRNDNTYSRMPAGINDPFLPTKRYTTVDKAVKNAKGFSRDSHHILTINNVEELSNDELDIRGRVHNEPDYIFMIRYSDDSISYFGVDQHN